MDRPKMDRQKMDSPKITLAGSARRPAGTRVGDVPGDEMIAISVILKPKTPVPVPAAGGAVVSRRAFAEAHGADLAAIERVREFAQVNQLTVTDVAVARRTVRLEGTVANMTRAFGVRLERYSYAGSQYRARAGSITIPANLTGDVEAVLGLDDRPQAKPHFRIRHAGAGGRQTSGARASAAAVSYSPPQVAQLYGFPSDVDGSGQTVAILELGGGYTPANLKSYFASLGISEPSVVSVSVDNGNNSPTDANSADGEVQLDIEVAGAVAPGAKIVVYFAPNTTAGFQDALSTAIHDETHKPSVISISWGGPESTWTAQAMKAFDLAAQDAAALGVSICAASGDDGSSDGVTDGGDHVDFPSSSPHILACGGTSLQSKSGAITSEAVWNDGAQGGAAGGGFSRQFALPAWQASAGVKPTGGGGRGVPDVSGDADPQTGYDVLVDGTSMVIGGTSAVAPLWSGLIALLNQKLGTNLGFLQPTLYGLPRTAGAFHDIVTGSNGSFAARPGWDAASGLGSPAAPNLLKAITAKVTRVET